MSDSPKSEYNNLRAAQSLQEMLEAEGQLFNQFDGILESGSSNASLSEPKHRRHVGIGLSGGGIRSATLSLGIFQALAKLGQLHKVGYLSTVSGGGYFGGFFGRLFHRDPNELAQPNTTTDDSRSTPEIVNDLLSAQPESAQVNFLRENGRYIAPNGSGDLSLATSVILRNWLSIHLVLATYVLMLFLLMNLLRYGADAAIVASGGAWLYSLPPLMDAPRWLWPSPYFILPALMMIPVLAFGMAYWLVPDRQNEHDYLSSIFDRIIVVLIVMIGALVLAFQRGNANPLPWEIPIYWSVAVIIALALLLFVWTWCSKAGLKLRDRHSRSRHSLSLGTSRCLIVLLGLAIVAAIDTLGQSLYREVATADNAINLAGTIGSVSATSITGVVLFTRKLATLTDKPKADRKRRGIPKSVFIYSLAFVLIAFVLITLSATAHGFTWFSTVPSPDKVWSQAISMTPLLIVTGLTLFLSWTMGRTWSFVNRSGHHQLYEARLRRAYLGASNPQRLRANEPVPVVRVSQDDGIDMNGYRPIEHGGPIHLVNVTINETVMGKSQLQQTDRKGMAMAIGPAGVNVGTKHHAIWDNIPKKGETPCECERFYVFPPTKESFECEQLDLGHWIALSGAAFSTGVGYRTNLGLSLLTGLFNIRMGYWWQSGVRPDDRGGKTKPSIVSKVGSFAQRLFPVQAALLQEFTARFPGVARSQWYLSDGGHFENLGGYELIRRRLPLVIICDNEQDAEYTYHGLANLVRLARVDFDTTIEFMDEEKLERKLHKDMHPWFGTLDQLRRGKWGSEPVKDPVTMGNRLTMSPVDLDRRSLAHAALANVIYPAIYKKDGTVLKPRSQGLILYIKPSLVGDEPADVQRYHLDHPDFPHESTGDQFFDESQWESYRKLGGHIASKLFANIGSTDDGDWTPYGALNDPTHKGDSDSSKKKARKKKMRKKKM